jgi:hypothetical protein
VLGATSLAVGTLVEAEKDVAFEIRSVVGAHAEIVGADGLQGCAPGRERRRTKCPSKA